MMKTIYKYPVVASDYFQIAMPEGAEILTVQKQADEAQIWALVDTDKPVTLRNFRLVGTGAPFAEHGARYIGTFQVFDGVLVLHVFEVEAP